jgi:membrane protease YdiL (CAAX protease family)
MENRWNQGQRSLLSTKMENNNYPTIKNASLLILLFIGIILVSVIIIILIRKIFTIDVDSPIVDILEMAATILGYLIIFKIGLKKSKRPFNEIFKFNKVPGFIWIFFITTMVGFVIISSEIDNLVNFVLPMPPFIVYIFTKLFISKNIILSIFLVAIIPPIFEEMFFRGLLVDGFRRNYTLPKTILVSSLLFGLIHLNPWQFVTAFLIGIFYSWICIKTNSILLPIFGHFLNNFLFLIALRYESIYSIQGFNTNNRFPVEFQPLWLDALGLFLFGYGLISLYFIFESSNQ